jgi:hypothetical protein
MFDRKENLRLEYKPHIGLQFCCKLIMLNACLTINVKTCVATEIFLLSARIMEVEGPNYWYQDLIFTVVAFDFSLILLPYHVTGYYASGEYYGFLI